MKFSKQQAKILAACVIIYTVAYINRLNLSAALGSMREALQVSVTESGLLQTLFAVVYAAGQFVNGAIVDRVNPIRHMIIGICGSGVCNLLMGLLPYYPAIAALCLLNGAFQSMLWTPIVRLFAEFYEPGAQRRRANLMESLTLVAGHLVAWAISGYMSSLFSWRYSFIVPAFIVIPCVISCLILLKGVHSKGAASSKSSEKSETADAAKLPVMKLFAATGFILILLECIFYGVIKDATVTWAPDILKDIGGNGLSSTAFSLIIPVINMIGIFAGYKAQQKSRQGNRPMLVIVMCIAALFSLVLLLIKGGMFFTALFLGLICACMSGMNPILTALVPLEYEKAGRVGLTAGLIDSFVYVGSSLAGVAGGAIYATRGASSLYLVFIGCALIGAVLTAVSARIAKGNKYLND